jgi:methyl-accepting chemotaxis protein
MEFIADILLLSGALGAAVYCYVLSRRLSRFNDLEKGVGGAVAVLSAQVDDLSKALDNARDSASESTGSLEGLTERAEDVARRLELLVAAMHDLPEPSGAAREADGTGTATETTVGVDMGDNQETQMTATPPRGDGGPLFFRHADQSQ